MPIDDSFLVIRGYGDGSGADLNTRSPLQVTQTFCVMVVVLSVNWALFDTGKTSFAKQIGFLLVLLTLMGGLMAWRRFTIDGPPAQIWVHEKGFWVRSRASLQTDRQRNVVEAMMFFLALTVLAAWAVFASGILWLIPFVAIVFLGLAQLKASRESEVDLVAIDVPGHGTVRFFAWTAINDVALIPTSKEQSLLKITFKPPTIWTIHRRKALKFRFDQREADGDCVRRHLLRVWQRSRWGADFNGRREETQTV